ncbi:MAG: 4Fe-4S dicluster domain-containing protein [Armatimonadota bacterium]|nr:4Fe-4S dicluster domain-containing protein [Armatimonadota bacterium]MDR5697142.1 4Fe-4S dicluster domain-containing protein [Armatimonadota bacterium]
MPAAEVGVSFVVEVAHLQDLFEAFGRRGYTIVGPVLRDGAIVYDRVESVADLPAGWTDEQDGGTYRLRHRNDGALFGYAVGPHSWKKFLFPPQLRLWTATRSGGLCVQPEATDVPQYAFVGVRSCELHAIAIQDRVFLEGPHPDPTYRAVRERCFIVAVNCGQAGGTCFCVSMGTGPKATSGYDLALTEVIEGKEHYFVAQAASQVGAAVLSEVRRRPAEPRALQAAERTVARAAAQMGRTMEVAGIKDLLYRNYEHPRWDEVAARCLTCGNCTMVCPTCFCSTVEDTTDLTGDHAERWRRWDSCFTMDFSYIHGGSVRASARSRYRQWMTHKLATWIDQFGTSGCVGCGRCITWCPVGIDITEEVRAIRHSDAASGLPEGGGGHGGP